MQMTLPLENFTLGSDFYLSDRFPNSCFDLLGAPLKTWIQSLLNHFQVSDKPIQLGEVEPHAIIKGAVYIAEGAKVESGAYIIGPTIIGPGTEVRHGAYIRGNVFAGKNCVIGHTTEIKGSVMLDNAKAGHFAYIGDSILCQNVNLGAGTKLANLNLNNRNVFFKNPQNLKHMDSGLRKFGAIMAANSQTGCNAVLSPGTLLMPNTAVYPCTHFRGTLTSGYAK